MPARAVLLGALVSMTAGLDRTAVLQAMLGRPLVVAPLTGWLLGDAASGLAIGVMLELLWLSRLPVGAAIPIDDTQVAVGATVLAVGIAPALGLAGPGVVPFALLLALPFGKTSQWYERWMRTRNQRLLHRADAALAVGDLRRMERFHLSGVANFAASALASYFTIVAGGSLLLWLTAPLLLPLTAATHSWIALVLLIVGSAVLIHTLHLRRGVLLFAAAFVGVFLFFRLT